MLSEARAIVTGAREMDVPFIDFVTPRVETSFLLGKITEFCLPFLICISVARCNLSHSCFTRKRDSNMLSASRGPVIVYTWCHGRNKAGYLLYIPGKWLEIQYSYICNKHCWGYFHPKHKEANSFGLFILDTMGGIKLDICLTFQENGLRFNIPTFVINIAEATFIQSTRRQIFLDCLYLMPLVE